MAKFSFWDKLKPKSRDKAKQKTTTDVTFQNTVCHVPWNLRTQERDGSVSFWEEIEACILGMFADSDEFVTLTAGEAPYHIRFVQAAQTDRGIDLELGIEEGDKTRLMGKDCSQKECMEAFREFYNTLNVWDRTGYKPVEFFV